MRKCINIFIICCICIPILGIHIECSKNKISISQLSPEEKLAEAKRLFEKEKYVKAKLQFTIIVLNNPGNVVVEEAQFYLAESYFHLKEYILAIEEYEKLIRSLPQSPFVDDCRYKIGVCYFKLSPMYSLDQEYTFKSISQFQIFLEEYPNSELKSEVEAKLNECRLKLAKKEFKTGELYRKTNSLRAAIISYDDVLLRYYDTKYAVDALYWKGVCHRKMSQLDEAKKAFQTLVDKHFQSAWIEKAKDFLIKIKEAKEKKEQDNTELTE